MTKFESGEALQNRLIRRIADAYINDDKETFEYASQIFDQIVKSKHEKALARLAINLEKRIGLDGNPLVEQVSNSDQETQPSTTDLSIFETMPNRRESLSAVDQNGSKVYFNHSIAKKLYRCYRCSGNIDIGSEHVVMGLVQRSKKHNHHHIHHPCLQDKILPTLKNIKVLNPSKTTATLINAKSRKLRNRQKVQAS